MDLLEAFAAAFIAGGGSMISFPLLIALGLPAINANATNTAGIWAGAIGSVWGFRREFSRIPKRMYWLMIPAMVGGILGALLLRLTSPEIF